MPSLIPNRQYGNQRVKRCVLHLLWPHSVRIQSNRVSHSGIRSATTRPTAVSIWMVQRARNRRAWHEMIAFMAVSLCSTNSFAVPMHSGSDDIRHWSSYSQSHRTTNIWRWTPRHRWAIHWQRLCRVWRCLLWTSWAAHRCTWRRSSTTACPTN